MEQEEQCDATDWKLLPIDPSIFAGLEAPGTATSPTSTSEVDANE
jgi:hypothetical protein